MQVDHATVIQLFSFTNILVKSKMAKEEFLISQEELNKKFMEEGF